MTYPEICHAQGVGLSLVEVGNAGNLGDTKKDNDGTKGWGAVDYDYYIGKYLVTVQQYTDFLNAVAQTDPYGLYNPKMATDAAIAGIRQSGNAGAYTYSVIGASGSDPIAYITWLDAARFCNWMQHGQPSAGVESAATTEQGVYTLNGDIDASGTTGLETKVANATWWIPTEDEWYKAAYYNAAANNGAGGYYPYAFATNSVPGNIVGNRPNEANFIDGGIYSVTQSSAFSSTQNYLSPVGAFTACASYYGTFDQTGELYEWNDSIINLIDRGRRGGDWGEGPSVIVSTHRDYEPPGTGIDFIGFRVSRSAAVPFVSSTLMATGTVTYAFKYQIAATIKPVSYRASNLPTGLSYVASTGLISGTPQQTGTFNVTIGAAYAAGTDLEPLTLAVVAPPPPQVSGNATATGTNGLPFDYQIIANNHPTGYDATGLPPGLTVDGTTGLISGTATQSGTFPATLTASNLGGTGSDGLQVVIITPPPPVISSTLSVTGNVGSLFDYQIQATNVPTSFPVTGALPPGLGFSASTGLISGTPTQTGTFTPAISAINAGGTDTETLTVTVLPPLPVISSASMESATNGSSFFYQIAATNNPTGFNATGLPPGVNVDTTTGQITGTPTAGGVYRATISATNVGGTVSSTLTITVTVDFALIKGSYSGLATIGGTGRGLLTLSLSRAGLLSGRLATPAGAFAFAGNSAPYGVLNENRGSANASLSINAAIPEITGTITTTVRAVATTYAVEGGLLGVYTARTLPVGLAGRYTAFVAAIATSGSALPDAASYSTMTVAPSGAIHLAGKLGDGTPFAAASQLRADGSTWTLYTPLYPGAHPGSLAGMAYFTTQSGSASFTSSVSWVKPTQTTGAYYRQGFETPGLFIGGEYASPPLLSGSTYNIEIERGNLAVPITDDLTVSTTGRVTITSSPDNGSVTLALVPATGLFSGTFLDPATNKRTAFGGAFFQGAVSPGGFGLFLGANTTGSVSIQAGP